MGQNVSIDIQILVMLKNEIGNTAKDYFGERLQKIIVYSLMSFSISYSLLARSSSLPITNF
jgi:hypothetical protein